VQCKNKNVVAENLKQVYSLLLNGFANGRLKPTDAKKQEARLELSERTETNNYHSAVTKRTKLEEDYHFKQLRTLAVLMLLSDVVG
jgi:hypothetical protein